jgi:hypothetical protein
MPRLDGRIEKGQSLRSAISARAWNRAQDAADLVLGATQSVTVDGLSMPLVASLAITVEPDTNTPLALFGQPRLISFGTVDETVVPYGSAGGPDSPVAIEDELSQRNSLLLGARVDITETIASLHINPVVGVCVDPQRLIYVIRGIVPVRIMAPLKTTTNAVAQSLRCGILYPHSGGYSLRLVAAGGVRVQPYTKLEPTGESADLPAQGWGVAVL